MGKALGIFLDGAEQQTRRNRIAGRKQPIELPPGNDFALLVCEWIGAAIVYLPPQIVEDRVKGAPARAVSDESVAFPDFEIVGIDFDRRKGLRAVMTGFVPRSTGDRCRPRRRPRGEA